MSEIRFKFGVRTGSVEQNERLIVFRQEAHRERRVHADVFPHVVDWIVGVHVHGGKVRPKFVDRKGPCKAAQQDPSFVKSARGVPGGRLCIYGSVAFRASARDIDVQDPTI